MRKIQLLGLFIISLFLLTACKETKKQEVNDDLKTENNLTIDKENTTISWIAYKTTSKVPVKGSFTEFTVGEIKGNNAKEILDGLKFSIPVSSLHTNDSIRDGKLIKSFFGNLENTSEITGTLHMANEQSGSAEINMNGISQTIPATFLVNGQTVNIESTIDLNNWKAQAAIEALNAVCFDLHKGEDGISKTWDDVKIEIVINLKSE